MDFFYCNLSLPGMGYNQETGASACPELETPHYFYKLKNTGTCEIPRLEISGFRIVNAPLFYVKDAGVTREIFRGC